MPCESEANGNVRGVVLMTLLEQFASDWAFCRFKIENERINGLYGFIMECDNELWVWTHSHGPNGHEFLPIRDGYDELKAIYLMRAF